MKIGLNDFPSGKIYVKMRIAYFDRVSQLIQKSRPILPDQVKAQIYNMSKGQKVPLSLVKDLARIFSFHESYSCENIELITSSKNTDVGVWNPRFPIIISSPEGARLIAAIMGDGELNRNMQIRYNNQDKELIDGVLHCAKSVFGDITYRLYKRPDNTYCLHLPRITGLMTIKLRLLPGHKSFTNNSVPGFLLKSRHEMKRSFLAQFYSDEGNVRLKDRRLQIKQTCVINVNKVSAKISPETYCARSLLGIKKMLASLGVESIIKLASYRIKSDGNRADWELTSYGKHNLLAFQKNVGFYLSRKNQMLDLCIMSYKFPSAPRNRRLEFALRNFKFVEKRDGLVTKHSLARQCERSVKVATYYIIDLHKNNLIKCIRKPRDNKGYFLPREFISASILGNPCSLLSRISR